MTTLPSRLEDRSRLAVDPRGSTDHPASKAGSTRRAPGPRSPRRRCPLDHAGPCRRCRRRCDVGGEQLLQPVDVAFAEGVEEPGGQLLALSSVGGEPRPTRLHVPASSDRELAACGLRTPDRRRDLREVEPEHVPEHEHRAFERAQPLEQQQRRHRHRVGELRGALRVLVRIGQQRLGEPRPDVRLPLDPGRAQDVDRDPRDHGREVRLRRGLFATPLRSHVSWTASSASLTLPRIR